MCANPPPPPGPPSRSVSATETLSIRPQSENRSHRSSSPAEAGRLPTKITVPPAAPAAVPSSSSTRSPSRRSAAAAAAAAAPSEKSRRAEPVGAPSAQRWVMEARPASRPMMSRSTAAPCAWAASAGSWGSTRRAADKAGAPVSPSSAPPASMRPGACGMSAGHVAPGTRRVRVSSRGNAMRPRRSKAPHPSLNDFLEMPSCCCTAVGADLSPSSMLPPALKSAASVTTAASSILPRAPMERKEKSIRPSSRVLSTVARRTSPGSAGSRT
eukprot:scaffold2458_cov121-Isochrysis_galbana.AAC.5